MRCLLFACATLVPPTAVAQPFSESMMDCAALYQSAAQFVSTEANSEKLIYLSRQWAQKAISQTSAEGSPQSEATVMHQIDAKAKAWEAKGASVFMAEEFRDWTAYCKAFGRTQGIRTER